MFFSAKRIYLDYASAPPVRDEALRAMQAGHAYYGNPGAIHREGAEALAALTDARERIARFLSCKARELVFTSGLTEANALAVVGHARHLERVKRSLAGTHWIVSAIEHASVLESFAEVERMGGAVTHLMPDERGVITAEAIRAALKEKTVFVSVGWGNNEIGTVQPLSEIARAIRSHEERHGTTVLLHADAGQAPLYRPTTAHTLGVDVLALGGNKLYGPHGVGALYLSNRASVTPLTGGGKQERGLRAGTENVALALGFAAACEAAAAEREAEAQRLGELRDRFAEALASRIPGLVVNGDLRRALPHMLNVSIPEINSEYVTLALDAKGIAVSTKSACHEGEESRSHVVAALRSGAAGDDSWRARNTLRFSLGSGTTARELDRAADVLAAIVRKARP